MCQFSLTIPPNYCDTHYSSFHQLTHSLSLHLHLYQYDFVGEKAWVRVIEDYIKRRDRAQYRLDNKGKPAPEPFHTALLKKVFPYFFNRSKYDDDTMDFITGQEMEVRMRKEVAIEAQRKGQDHKLRGASARRL